MSNVAGVIRTLIILGCLICVSCRSSGFRRESEIYTAARVGQVTLLETLLKKGGAANWHDLAGNTPLTIAAKGAKWEAVDVILRYRPALVQETGEEGNSLLHFAAAQGRNEWVEKLVGWKVSLEAKNQAGSTPLHLAAFAGQLKSVRSLVSLGADRNALNHYRESPLHVATWQRHFPVVEALLAADAKTSLRAAKGETLLHYATQKCSPELIRLYTRFFRKHPQGMDPRDASGVTPLMLALSTKESSCERALVEGGARVRGHDQR